VGTQIGAQAGAQTGAQAAGGFGSASSIAGAAGALYGAYSLFSNFGTQDPASAALHGATTGAYLGSQIMPGWGTVVGGALGAIVGGISSLFGDHKHKDVVARDGMREQLRAIGMIDEKNNIMLADGSLYSISGEGGPSLMNLDGLTKRRHYNVDFSNPLAADTVPLLNPIGKALYGQNEKLAGDLSAYLINAALSNVDPAAPDAAEQVIANVLAIYAQVGVPIEQIAGVIAQQGQQGYYGEQEATVYLHSLARLMDVASAAQASASGYSMIGIDAVQQQNPKFAGYVQ
jgi:energy-converting hydrogenase Eha subunit F